MIELSSTVAQQIAQAAITFEKHRSGRAPSRVTVVLNDDMLVITLHDALSPAEKALARNPAGADQVQEFHRQLFANASDGLRQQIKSITGVEVVQATEHVDTTTGALVKVFSNGTVVQIYLLAGGLVTDSWSGSGEPL